MLSASTSRPEADRSLAALPWLARLVSARRWTVAGTLTLVLLSTAFFTLRQEPRYEASADVLLSRQNLAASLARIDDRSTASTDLDRFTQTQADVARAPVVARRVAEAIGPPGRNAAELLRNSEVRTKKDSDVLQFRARDENRQVAAKIATRYATEFTRYRRELDTTALRRASGEVEARLRDLRRADQQRTALYRTLIRRQEQLSTLEALQTSNAFVLRAAGDAVKVQPQPLRNAMLALLLGALLALGLAWARDSLDTRVRSTEEIEAGLAMPMLARTPLLRGERASRELPMVAAPGSVEAEAFRKLRTSLEFAQLDQPTREIIVTSAAAREGKTTTAANLAVALARGGRNVVVVDLDLRRPALADLFGLASEPGLTNVALGHAELDEALVEQTLPRPRGSNGSAATPFSTNGAEQGRLRVLPTGPLPPDPGEFVGTPALGRVLDSIAELADLVLLDTPPLIQVGDATRLSARGGGLLIVSRLQLVRRAMLPELRRLIDASPAVKLGFVAAGVDPAPAGYGYGYGYGYDSGRPEQSRSAEKREVS